MGRTPIDAERRRNGVILYFLRHGEAEDPLPEGDDQRRLTRAGVVRLRRAAAIWRRLNLRPEVVITSPLPRAAQTAALFTEGVSLPRPPVPDQRLAPGADWADLARAMAAHADARRIMFVGHEPDLSRAVALLTGAASVRLRKGGVACLEFYGTPEPGGGELVWLLDPDLYAADAG